MPALLAAYAAARAARETQSFDFGWKHWLGPHPGYNDSTAPCEGFTVEPGTQCPQLRAVRSGSVYSPASAAECQQAACEAGVDLWTWGPEGNPRCSAGRHAGAEQAQCIRNAAYTSGRRAESDRGFQPSLPVRQRCPQSPTCGAAFSDAGWREVDVPHDFIVEGTFSPTADRNHGYLPYNVSFYRKTFTLDAAWSDKLVWIDFDGVYRSSDWWLNSVYLGHHESGYTAFRWHIHNVSGVNFGGENVLTARVDALTYQEGWFYEGGGIYRHTKLVAAEKVGIVPWGVYAPSMPEPGAPIDGSLDEPQTASSAILNLQVDVASALDADNASVTVTNVISSGGRPVARVSSTRVLPPRGFARVAQALHFPQKPPSSGFVVQMAQCSTTLSQRFTLGDGRVTIPGAGGEMLCLDSGDAQPTKPPMVLKPCKAGSPAQLWTATPPSPVKCNGAPCTHHIFTRSAAGTRWFGRWRPLPTRDRSHRAAWTFTVTKGRPWTCSRVTASPRNNLCSRRDRSSQAPPGAA